jgi:dTDP-glucose 4,6-dehydratase
METTVRWYLENREWWSPLKSGEFWEFYRRNYRPVDSGAS